MTEFTRLNTTFKIPESVAKQAMAISLAVNQQHGSSFVLDGVNFYPHITVYSPEYPNKNIDKILDKIEKISSNHKPMKFKFKQIESHQGFIGIVFELTPKIKQIHRQIVSALNPLRAGHIRDKDRPNGLKYDGYTKQEKSNIEKYGYPLVMDLYTPHLTITRVENEKLAERIVDNIDWNIKKLTINELAIYTTGVNGTCTKLTKSFKLKI